MAEETPSAQDPSPSSITVHCTAAITPVTTVTMATTALTATGTSEAVDCTIVPVGWKRSVQGGAVIYISPSNHMLHSEAEVRQYLLKDGTCKCGLECPLVVTRVFNFDPNVPSRSRTVQEATSDGALTKLCNHKRKVIAMAVLQQSGVEMRQPVAPHGCALHGGGVPSESAPPIMPPKASKQGKRSRGRPKSKPQDKMMELQHHHQNLSVSQLLALRGAETNRQAMAFNQMALPYPPMDHMHNMDLHQQQQLQLHLMRLQQQQHMQQQLQLQMQHQHHFQQHQQGLGVRHQGGMAPPKSPLDCSPPPMSPMHSPTMPPHRSPLSRHGTPSPAHSANYCKSPAHSDLSSPSPGLVTPKEGFFPPGIPFGPHMGEISPEMMGHTPSVIPLASNVLHPSHRGSMTNTQTVCSSHTSPHSHGLSPEHVQSRLPDGANLIHPSHILMGPIPDPQVRHLPEDVRATLAVSRLAGLPEQQMRNEQLAQQENRHVAETSVQNKPLQKVVQKETNVKQQKPEKMPSIEQILGPPDAGAFPASTLLTAAAKAQLASQAQQNPTSSQGTNQGPVLSKMGLLMNNNNSNLAPVGGPPMGEFNPMMHLSQVAAGLSPCAIPNKRTPSRKRKSPTSKPNKNTKSLCDLYEECMPTPESTSQDSVLESEGSTSPHPAKRKVSSSSAKSPIECLESAVQNIETNPNPERDRVVDQSPHAHLLYDPYNPGESAEVHAKRVALGTAAHQAIQSETLHRGTDAEDEKVTAMSLSEQSQTHNIVGAKPPVTLPNVGKSSSVSTMCVSTAITTTAQVNPMLHTQQAVLPSAGLTEEEKAKQEQEWYLSMIKNTAHFTNIGGIDPFLQHVGMGSFMGHGGVPLPNVAQYRQALLGVGAGIAGPGMMQGNPSIQSLAPGAAPGEVPAPGHGINALAQVAATLEGRHPKRSRVEALAQAQNALGLQHRIDLLKNPEAIMQGFHTAQHQQQDAAMLQMLLQQQQHLQQQMANFHAQNALGGVPPNQVNMPNSMETLAAVAAAQQSASVPRTPQTKRKRSKSKSNRDDPPYKSASRSKSPSRASGVRKVKDILAEARSARQMVESSGQVDAIYQAVVDSASGGVKVMIAPEETSQAGTSGEVPSGTLNVADKNNPGEPQDDAINVRQNVPVPPVVSLSTQSSVLSEDQVHTSTDRNESNMSSQESAHVSQDPMSTIEPPTSEIPKVESLQHDSEDASDESGNPVQTSQESVAGCNRSNQGSQQSNLISQNPVSPVSPELNTSSRTSVSPCPQSVQISQSPVVENKILSQASGDVQGTQELVETEPNLGQSKVIQDSTGEELSTTALTCNSSKQSEPCHEKDEIPNLPSNELIQSNESNPVESKESNQQFQNQEQTNQKGGVADKNILPTPENESVHTDLSTEQHIEQPSPVDDEELMMEQSEQQCNLQSLNTSQNKAKEHEQSTQPETPTSNQRKIEQPEQSLPANDSTPSKDKTLSGMSLSDDKNTFQETAVSSQEEVLEGKASLDMDHRSSNTEQNVYGTNNTERDDTIKTATSGPEAMPEVQMEDDSSEKSVEPKRTDVDHSSQTPNNTFSDVKAGVSKEDIVHNSGVMPEMPSNSENIGSEEKIAMPPADCNKDTPLNKGTISEMPNVAKSDVGASELLQFQADDKGDSTLMETQPALKTHVTNSTIASNENEKAEESRLSDEQMDLDSLSQEPEIEFNARAESSNEFLEDQEVDMEVDDNIEVAQTPPSSSSHAATSFEVPPETGSSATRVIPVCDNVNPQETFSEQIPSPLPHQDELEKEESLLKQTDPLGIVKEPVVVAKVLDQEQVASNVITTVKSASVASHVVTRVESSSAPSNVITTVESAFDAASSAVSTVKSATDVDSNVITTVESASVVASNEVECASDAVSNVKTTVESASYVVSNVETTAESASDAASNVATTVESASNVDSKVESASDLANNVITTIESAPDVASNVITTVESASDVTSNVITTVESASDVASNVVTTVESASDVTRNVITTVESASDVASNVVTTVESASDVASSVITTVESASDVTSNVVTTVVSASDVASNVVESASDVVSNVKTTVESASVASDVITTVDTGSDVASNVITTVEPAADVVSNVTIDEPVADVSKAGALTSEGPSGSNQEPMESIKLSEGASGETSDRIVSDLRSESEDQEPMEHSGAPIHETKCISQDVGKLNSSDAAAIHTNNSNSNSSTNADAFETPMDESVTLTKPFSESRTSLSKDVDRKSPEMCSDHSESGFPYATESVKMPTSISLDKSCDDINQENTTKISEAIQMEAEETDPSCLSQSNAEMENNPDALMDKAVECKPALETDEDLVETSSLPESVSVDAHTQRTTEFVQNTSLEEVESKLEGSDCGPSETGTSVDSTGNECNTSRTKSETSIRNNDYKVTAPSSGDTLSSALRNESVVDDLISGAASCEPHTVIQQNVTERTKDELEQTMSENVDNISDGALTIIPSVETSTEISHEHCKNQKIPESVKSEKLSVQMSPEGGNNSSDAEMSAVETGETVSNTVVSETISGIVCETRTKESLENVSMDTDNTCVDTSENNIAVDMSSTKTSTPIISTPVESFQVPSESSICLDVGVVESPQTKLLRDSSQECIQRTSCETSNKPEGTNSTESMDVSKPDDNVSDSQERNCTSSDIVNKSTGDDLNKQKSFPVDKQSADSSKDIGESVEENITQALPVRDESTQETGDDVEESSTAEVTEDVSSKPEDNHSKPSEAADNPADLPPQDSSGMEEASYDLESSVDEEKAGACVSSADDASTSSNPTDGCNQLNEGNANGEGKELVAAHVKLMECGDESQVCTNESISNQETSSSKPDKKTNDLKGPCRAVESQEQNMHAEPVKESTIDKAKEEEPTCIFSESPTAQTDDTKCLTPDPEKELKGTDCTLPQESSVNTSITSNKVDCSLESERCCSSETECGELKGEDKPECESVTPDDEERNVDARSPQETCFPVEASFNHNEAMVCEQETNGCSLLGGKSTEPLLLDTSEFAVKKDYKSEEHSNEITENGTDLFHEEPTGNMQSPGNEVTLPVQTEECDATDETAFDGGDADVESGKLDTGGAIPELKSAPSPQTSTVPSIEAGEDGEINVPNDIDCDTSSHCEEPTFRGESQTTSNSESVTDGEMEISNDIDHDTSRSVGPTLRSESKENITPDKKDMNEHSRVEEEHGRTELDGCHGSHEDVLEEMADNSDMQDMDSLCQETDEPESPEPIEAAIPRNFETGDLVWGQIRGYPSWPGKLVSDSDVRGTARRETGRSNRREEGKVWVMWFGDHSYTQVETGKLKTLSEGLEAHHRARKRNRRGRKMNSGLEAAIQEAMLELDKQSELGTDKSNPASSKSSGYKPKAKRKRLR